MLDAQSSDGATLSLYTLVKMLCACEKTKHTESHEMGQPN